MNSNNFDELMKSSNGKPYVVKFYDPWCSHCKEFQPKWVYLIENSKFKDNVIFAETNCLEHKRFCLSKSVNGYPEVLYFDTQTLTHTEYDGVMQPSSIDSFIEKQLHFPFHILNSTNDLTPYLKLTNSSSLFILHFNNESTLQQLKQSIFSYRNSTSYFFAIHSFTSEQFYVYRSPINITYYEGDWSLTSLNDFIRRNISPIFGPFTDTIYDEMRQLKSNFIITFINNSTQYINCLNIFINNCKFPFYYVNYNDYKTFSKFVGINFNQLPQIIVINLHKQKWSLCPYNIKNISLIIEWINEFDDKKVKWNGPGNQFFALVRQVYSEGGLKYYVLVICLAMIALLIVLFIVDVLRNYFFVEDYAKFE